MADVELTVDLETAKALREASKFAKGIGKVDKQATTMQRNLKRIGTAAKVGFAAATGAVVAGGFAAKKAVESWVELENEIARTNTVAKLSGAGLDEMKSKIDELSKSSGKGAVEIATSLEKVFSAGFGGGEAYDVLAVGARAANAGFITMDDSISGLIASMKTFGLSAEDAADNMFFTKEKGIIQADQYGKAISRIGNAAKVAGINAHEFGAAMATMTKTGAPVEEATTQFKALLRTLTKKDFQIKLGGLLGQTTFNVEQEGIEKTITSFRELQKKMDSVDFAAIFPDDESKLAMLGLLNTAGGTAEELIGMKEAVKGATKAAELLAENPAKVLSRQEQELNEAFRKFGEAFAPGYFELMKDFTSTLVRNKDGLVAFGELMAKGIGEGAKRVATVAERVNTFSEADGGDITRRAAKKMGWSRFFFNNPLAYFEAIDDITNERKVAQQNSESVAFASRQMAAAEQKLKLEKQQVKEQKKTNARLD